MRIEDDVKLDFDDVLIRPKRSTLKSRKDVDLERTYTFKNSGNTWTGVPIIASNMDTIGTFDVSEVLVSHKMLTTIHKFYEEEDWLHNEDRFSEKEKYSYVVPSIGASEHELDTYQYRNLPYNHQFICIDVANGYGEYFVEFVEEVRSRFPNNTIIAGNVATGEMTEQLILSGADIVKIGIGPGSVCETRTVTGVGYPQLSSIIECADAAHGLGGHIIADGGCRTSGDVAKAFGAGADFVMLGGMFAGHDETSTDFYGMSSTEAQEKYYGQKNSYRASEGKKVVVNHRGPLKDTVLDLLGGLRSACTYVGAPTLKQFSKCTTFVRVNRTHNRVFDYSV